MEDKIVDYKPINFYKSIFFLFVKILLLFVCAWLFVYAFSNDLTKSRMTNSYSLLIILFFLVVIISILQTLLNNVYIYNISQKENSIIIRWQEFTQYKEVSVLVEDVSMKLQPSGKNTPYLELSIKQKDSILVLKQTYYPGWDKNTMKMVISKINDIKQRTQ